MKIVNNPNLHQLARLWKFVKKQCLNNCYYETFDTFQVGIDACLNDIDKQFQPQIASLMTA